MVKLKSNLGVMHGQLGGLRIYEVNGETIGACLPGKVSNPRSVAQMKQRIKLNNILANYSYIKPFLKDNFEGLRGNKNAASFFRSYNLMLTPVWLQEKEKLQNYCVLSPYVVSQGRIPSVNYAFQDDCFCTDIDLACEDLNANTTIMDLFHTIKSLNDGWSNGDMLKILVVRQSKDTTTTGYPQRPEGAALSIELSNSRKLLSAMPMLELLRKADLISLCNIDGKLAVRVTDTVNYTYAFAVVHTRGEGMEVKASTQKICLSDNELYDYYCSDEAMTLALKSYKTQME